MKDFKKFFTSDLSAFDEDHIDGLIMLLKKINLLKNLYLRRAAYPKTFHSKGVVPTLDTRTGEVFLVNNSGQLLGLDLGDLKVYALEGQENLFRVKKDDSANMENDMTRWARKSCLDEIAKILDDTPPWKVDKISDAGKLYFIEQALNLCEKRIEEKKIWKKKKLTGD